MSRKHSFRCPRCKLRIPNRLAGSHSCELKHVDQPVASWDCRHAGETIRFETCDVCSEPREAAIVHCRLFDDECTQRKYRRAGQTPRICNRCDRFEKRVRVGFLAESFFPFGGAETWHTILLPALAELDALRVVAFVPVFGLGGDLNKLARLAGHGLQVGTGIEEARKVAAAVDVLVEWGTYDLAEVLPAQSRPAVISVHHGDLNSEWSEKMIAAKLEYADAIVCVNEAVAADLRLRGFPSRYIPNAVWNPVVIKQPRPPRPRVVWMGRFSPEKRPGFVIEIAKVTPEVDFIIFGDGALAGQLRDAARGVANVRIEKPKPSAQILADADLLLSTSSSEGFGYSMAEAMLAEVPVVATPVGLGANAHICENWMTRERYHTLEAWRLAIRNEIADPQRVAAARQFILDNHSIETVADAWETLILDLAHLRSE